MKKNLVILAMLVVIAVLLGALWFKADLKDQPTASSSIKSVIATAKATSPKPVTPIAKPVSEKSVKSAETGVLIEASVVGVFKEDRADSQ